MLDVALVVARVARELAALELDDRVDGAPRRRRSWLTTSTAPFSSRRKRLEPLDAFEVEVVRRLVEQQAGRCRDELARQRGAAALAARQRRASRSHSISGKPMPESTVSTRRPVSQPPSGSMRSAVIVPFHQALELVARASLVAVVDVVELLHRVVQLVEARLDPGAHGRAGGNSGAA
jgi:hypothetical protein